MADLDWPADIVPFAVTFYLQPHTGGTESPFNRATKVYGLSAPRWICRMSLRAPDSADRWSGEVEEWGERLDAFLASLEGRLNRVSLWDFRREGRAPAFANAPVAMGDSQITLLGASAGDIREGEYIGGDGRPHIITDVSASSDGLIATLKPPFAEPLPAGAATFERVSGYFRLTSDDAAANPSSVGELTQYDLEFVEDWTGFSGSTFEAVTNQFDADHIVSGAARVVQRDKLYNNDGSTSVTIASGTSGHAFAVIGDFPVAVGKAGSLSVSAGPRNWVFNAARINFHSASPASAANLVSSSTTGITLSADLQTLTWVDTAVPVGAVCATTNIKYGQGSGGSIAYTASNEIPTGLENELPQFVMLNYALDSATLTAFGASGTVETVSGAPDLGDGEFIVCKNGSRILSRFPGIGPAGYDVVYREEMAEPNHDYGWAFQFLGRAEILSTTPAAYTPGQFRAEYSASGADDQSLHVESDDFPAYRMNGIGSTQPDQYAGGNHGILSLLLTATAHGKTNVDIGSNWSFGGKTAKLMQVPTANQVILSYLPPNTGDTTWELDATVPAAGTWAHVSGATHTTSIVATAVAQTQLYPALKNVQRSVSFGGVELTESGVYRAKFQQTDVSFEIPVPPRVFDAITARTGSTADPDYGAASIASQIAFYTSYLKDAYGAVGTRRLAKVITAHFRALLITQQWQAINRRTGETLRLFVPGVAPFQSGTSQNGGTPRDFAAATGADITSNALEYYFSQAAWLPGSIWKDGIQRPPMFAMMGAMTGAGAWRRQFVMAHDFVDGRTAEPNFSSPSMLLSAPNKLYMLSDYRRDVAAGEIDLSVGGFGVQEVGFDPQAIVNFSYPRTMRERALLWYRTDTTPLTDYYIPVRPDLIGKSVRVDAEMTTVTVLDDVVRAEGIRVSTTGAGGVALTIR